MKRLSVGLALLLALSLAACRQADPTPASTSDIMVDLVVRPQPPVVGEATLVVSLSDAAGNPVTDAEVSARGDMSHAGMVPVTGSTDAGSDGEYPIPFEWTMAGDWIVDVTVTLEDGRDVQQRFEVAVAGAMSMDQREMTAEAGGGMAMNHGAMTAEATAAADG